jgi:hypothetical protein
MAQIRASMQRKLKLKQIDEEAQKFKNINIATPLTENDNIMLEQESNNVSGNISDDEFSDTDYDDTASLNINKNIQNPDEWYSMISKWISMLDDEQDNEEEWDSDSNSDDGEMEYDINIMNISNLPHPAQDKNAKWRLQDIFTENLGEPSYLSDFK